MIIDEGQTEPGCPYIRSRIEQTERFAVSMNGKGRDDQIEALRSTRPAEKEEETFASIDGVS